MSGETATFSCSATNVNDIIFEVSLGGTTIDHSNWTSRGISQSAQIPSGANAITVYLTVRGDAANNGIEVRCCASYVGTTSTSSMYVDILPPAKLTVQGTVYRTKSMPSLVHTLISSLCPTAPPSAPQHLTAAHVGYTYVNLTWSPPEDPGIGGPLYYTVSYHGVNGSSNGTSNTTELTCNVTHLSPGHTYIMTVVAGNGVSGDEGNRSASINVTTHSTPTVVTTNSTPTVVPTGKLEYK